MSIQINTAYSENTNSRYGYARDMVYITGGGTYYSYEGLSNFMLGRIYNKVPQINGYRAIIGTGYKTVLFNRPISMQYAWHRGNYLDELTDNDDIDKDGLYDYQEILFVTANDPSGEWLVNIEDPYDIKLYTFEEIKRRVGENLFYVRNGLNRYRSATGDFTESVESLNSAHILPIKSDPTNKDTDCDGKPDKLDGRPLNEYIVLSQLNYDKTEEEQKDREDSLKLNVNSHVNFEYEQKMVVDFSWFYNSSKNYNKDLALASSVISALAYHTSSTDTSKGETSDRVSKYNDEYCYAAKDYKGTTPKILTEVMAEYNFKECKTINLRGYTNDNGKYYSYHDNHLIQFDIGYKDISEYSKDPETNGKKLLAIFVRGTHGTEEWYSNFDIGNTNTWNRDDPQYYLKNSDWHTKANHMGFDIAAYRAYKMVLDYISINNLNPNDTVIWITGHSRGAAVSGIMSTYLVDEGYDVFGYNFATPNQVQFDLLEEEIGEKIFDLNQN